MNKKEKMSHEEFARLFEYMKEDAFSERADETKEKKALSSVYASLEEDPTHFFYLLLKQLARMDRKIDIAMEIAEMYSFAATYCIAKRLNFTEKEINALYDEVDRETKLIVQKSVSAKEEMKYIAQMLALKYKAKKAK